MITLIPSLLLFGSIAVALPAPMPSPTTYPSKAPKIDLSFPDTEGKVRVSKNTWQSPKFKERFSDPADLPDYNFVKPQFLGVPKQTCSYSPRYKKELSKEDTLGLLRGTPINRVDIQGTKYVSRQPSAHEFPGDDELSDESDSENDLELGDENADSVFAKMQRSPDTWNKKSISLASGSSGMGGDDVDSQEFPRKGHYTSGRQERYDLNTGDPDEVEEDLQVKMRGMMSSLGSKGPTSGLGVSNLGKNIKRPGILRAPIGNTQLLDTPKATPKGKEKRVTFSSELESERIISSGSRSQSRSPDSDNDGHPQRRNNSPLNRQQTLSAPKPKRIELPQQSELRPTLYLVSSPKGQNLKGSRGQSPMNTMRTTSNNTKASGPPLGRDLTYYADYLLVNYPGTKIYSPESRPRNMVVSIDSQHLLPGAQTPKKNSGDSHEWRRISPTRYEKYEKKNR